MSLEQTAAAAKENAVPIVDTHHHLWDLTKFNLPWVKGAGKLNRSFVMDDYYEATKGLNVVKSVYMEVDVAPEQRVKEAEYVIAICKSKKTPMRAAVISGEPSAPDFKDYIKQFKDNPYIKGVRRVLHGGLPPGHCTKPEFIRDVRLLGEMGMSYDICVRPAELGDAVKLVDACPDTRFILDHCGNANVQWSDSSQWKNDIAALAQRKNLICKVSGIIASAKPGAWTPADLEPYIKHVIAEFGWDRVIFGGDWPVCTLTATYKQWVDALKQIVRDATPEQQRKLFHDNAMRFYGLR